MAISAPSGKNKSLRQLLQISIDSADVSQINATYIDGVLRIDVDKLEEAKPARRQVEFE